MPEATPTIEASETPTGVRIADPIEDVRFTLLTPSPVDPDPTDPDAFTFPVDTAATVPTDAIETPYLVAVLVRDAEMNLLAQCASGESVSLDPGRYCVEVSSAKVKLYLRVEGGIDVEPRDQRVRLSFPGADRITVGVRSFHESPAATVTTTSDPADVATALSQLGSALKTTSPERSFPTLRGHPPLIERGDELAVPEAVDPPDTDVRVVVPPSLDALYPVAPLAYYLGATVETRPGVDPALVVDGDPIALAHEGSIEAGAARVLRQTFLLDCVTRTEGYYQVALHERRRVEAALDDPPDFAALYDRPLASRVRSYLSVPYEAVADAVPAWKLTADVAPVAENLPALPVLADELAAVRCPADARHRALEDAGPRVSSFVGSDVRTDGRGRTRSGGNASPSRFAFEPEPADSIEQAYVGPGVPMGASKTTPADLHRRLDVEPTEAGRTRVVVVCNDPTMAAENTVSDVYGTREWIEFDIATREGLSTDDLADLLAEDVDFLHYIGHVDDEGIRCTDGHLDAHTLETVGVSAFLLNACQSYDQGRALVDAGALGGVVTLTEVLNRTATEIGRTVARFLNQGFSLLSMLDLLEKANPLAQRYMVVGDGTVSVVEGESGTPVMATVERTGPDQFSVDLFGYPSRNYHLGTLSTPFITDNDVQHLNAGPFDTYEVAGERLSEFLSMETIPVVVGDDLYWSDEVTVTEL